jgi:hypothetical protein
MVDVAFGIAGCRHRLWSAVDYEGFLLDVLV